MEWGLQGFLHHDTQRDICINRDPCTKHPGMKRLDLSWDVCVTVVMFTYFLSTYISKEVPKSFCQTLIGNKAPKGQRVCKQRSHSATWELKSNIAWMKGQPECIQEQKSYFSTRGTLFWLKIPEPTLKDSDPWVQIINYSLPIWQMPSEKASDQYLAVNKHAISGNDLNKIEWSNSYKNLLSQEILSI